MEVTKLLNLPKEEPTTTPTIVAKTTKIKSLIAISADTKKTSKKLRTIFEKGVYQKKTQLSVLTRYKKRLDSIEKQEESKQKKTLRKKLSPKNALPEFKSNFFSGQDDVFNNLAQLAAFKAFLNFGKGDIFTGLGQSLLAGGLLLGPAMLGGAAKGFFGKNQKIPRNYGNNLGWERAKQGRYGDKGGYAGAEKDIRERYTRRYGERAANKKFAGEAVETATKGAKVGKAFGRFGAALIPGVGAAVGVADAALRSQSGDQTGSAIAGTAAALDAAAAASAVTGIGLPVAGLLSVASFALDATNLIRDLSGASSREEEKNKLVQPQQTKIEDRLKEETQKQKEQTRASSSTLSFKTTLISYEKALIKFDEFVKGFNGTMGMNEQQVRETAARIEDLGGGSTPISAAGYEFTNESSFSQYLTGDPNAPGGAYDASHGTVSNYHDHLAFKDAATAKRAYDFLQSKGLTVTELGVTEGHSPGSAHYSGRAFDVPGRQWGGSPGSPIGQREYAGSAKVRAFMNDFYNLERQRSRGPDAVPTPRPSGTPQPPRPSGTPQPPRPSGTPQPPRPVQSRPSTLQQLQDLGIPVQSGTQIQSSNVDPIKRNPIVSAINSPMTRSITVPFPLPPQTQQMAMGASPQMPLNNEKSLERSIMYKAFS